MRQMLKLLALCLVLWLVIPVAVVAADEEPTAWQRVQERGALTVAVYTDFPPFSFTENGRVVGIDADIARALAERLGVAAVIRAVGADESMEDDLRNNVWKGHYLGGGVADVMLHVPYDKAFAEENDRVRIIAPYYREQIVVATRPAHAAAPLDAFTQNKVGVELDTLADFFLLSTNGGAIRDQVVHFRTLGEAVQALKRGELAGVAGPRAEVTFALGDQSDAFVVGPLPGLGRDGWDLGAAVKQGNDELARRIDDAMQTLRDDGGLKEIFMRYRTTYGAPMAAGHLPSASADKVAFSDVQEICKRRP